jgi:hypothetical protein
MSSKAVRQHEYPAPRVVSYEPDIVSRSTGSTCTHLLVRLPLRHLPAASAAGFAPGTRFRAADSIGIQCASMGWALPWVHCFRPALPARRRPEQRPLKAARPRSIPRARTIFGTYRRRPTGSKDTIHSIVNSTSTTSPSVPRQWIRDLPAHRVVLGRRDHALPRHESAKSHGRHRHVSTTSAPVDHRAARTGPRKCS